jgi:Mn2+/Fe2+ NRAMP family transporter
MILTLAEKNPKHVLFLSGVVNGLLAPPLMGLVMLVGSNRKIMGAHTSGFWLNLLGWTATGCMTAAAVAFVMTSFR